MVAQSVGQQEINGSTPCAVTVGKLFTTYVPLSASSIIWLCPEGSDTLWRGR